MAQTVVEVHSVHPGGMVLTSDLGSRKPDTYRHLPAYAKHPAQQAPPFLPSRIAGTKLLLARSRVRHLLL